MKPTRFIPLAGTATGLAYHNANNNKKTAEELRWQLAENHNAMLEQRKEEAQVLADLKKGVQECGDRVVKLENKLDEVLKSKPSSSNTGSASNNYLEVNDYIPSLDDLSNYFSSIQDYVNSIPFWKGISISSYIITTIVNLHVDKLVNGSLL